MFTEDWGEQEVGIRNPVAVVLDLRTKVCSVLATDEYADISMGQVENYNVRIFGTSSELQDNKMRLVFVCS